MNKEEDKTDNDSTIQRSKLNEFIKFNLSFTTMVICGNYSRMGITKLSHSYDPSYVTSGSIIWTNFTACVIMGILQTVSCYPTFQTQLTTGYCGTFSSFSTFIWELFQHSTNTNNYPNNAYGIMEFLSVLIIGIGMSMGGVVLGIHMGNSSKSYSNTCFFLKTVYRLSYIICIPLLIVLIVLSSVSNNIDSNSPGSNRRIRYWTLSGIFSIFGGYTRYYLSKNLNKIKNKNFPLGTFVSNILACLILSSLKIVLLSKKPIILSLSSQKNNNNNVRIILEALSDGLPSSLSTMSTFMVEGRNLPLVKTTVYYIASIGLSYCIFIVMVGSYKWTVGISDT